MQFYASIWTFPSMRIKVCLISLGSSDIFRHNFVNSQYILIISSLMRREYRALYYLYPNEMKILKWSLRKMRRNFPTFYLQQLKNFLQDSIIFRKLKYVPMSVYYVFVTGIWRIKRGIPTFTAIYMILKRVYQEFFLKKW